MIKMILLCFFTLMICSCGTQTEKTIPRTETVLATITKPVSPTNPPAHTTTIPIQTTTPIIIHTETQSTVLQPAATQTYTVTNHLPTLIASQPLTITQINMINTSIGWALGHQFNSGDRLLYTQDGGYSWEERTPPFIELDEQKPDSYKAWGYFYDKDTAWVIYIQDYQPLPIKSPVVWFTNNGGQMWNISQPLPLTGAESFFIPENFSFIDSQLGWLLVHVDAGMSHDYSNLYTTSDGGKTWQRLIDPYKEGLQSLQNTGLAFADSQYGWVTKDNLGVMPGTFLEETQNGGRTWEYTFLPTPVEFDWFSEISKCLTSHPIYSEKMNGIVLVNCETFEGQDLTYTFLTNDRGLSWQSIRLPTSVQSLFFINAKIGWALGRDIYQTTDGGFTWIKIKTVNWDGQFDFVDESTGWAVAMNEEAIAFVFTQDSGQSWQIIQPKIK